MFFITILLNVSLFASGQSILGNWFSEDRTRIYTIYEKSGHLEAVLLKSARKEDKVGTIILRDLIFRDKKKNFAGTIISAIDSSAAQAKIKFEDKDGKVLRLKLQRMFIMDITIRWYRVEENKIANQLLINPTK